MYITDSQVFAEEVEVTGCVPMELVLERYRVAALPGKYEGARGRARAMPQLFPGSAVLPRDLAPLQRLLAAWANRPNHVWRLVYRASTHGFSANAFHSHCDNVYPTYVIVLVSILC